MTDQIDGFLARRWHVESAFGKLADPLADRLLIDVAVVLLWHAGRLPWAAFAIPARDLAVIGLTPFALRRGYQFEVNSLGKLATWVLYLSLGLVMVVHGRGVAPLDLLGGLRARGRGVRAVLPEGAEGVRGGAGNLRILKLRLTVCSGVRCNPSEAAKGRAQPMELLPDLGSLSDEELKHLKDELEAQEHELSYQRRLLHGKIDILRAELVARLQKSGGRSVLEDVDVHRLTEILTGKSLPPT